LRTECGALGKQLGDDLEQRNSTSLKAPMFYTAHYQPHDNHCYVEIEQIDLPNGVTTIGLYDAQRHEVLASVMMYTKDGQLAYAYADAQIGNNRIGDNMSSDDIAYKKVKAFIDERMKEK
jgi:hypothetical protein